LAWVFHTKRKKERKKWSLMYAFKSKVRCRGGSVFEPGASGLPYYCTSTCVAVIGTLAVWRQNKNIKTKIEIQKEILDGHHSFLFIRLI